MKKNSRFLSWCVITLSASMAISILGVGLVQPNQSQVVAVSQATTTAPQTQKPKTYTPEDFRNLNVDEVVKASRFDSRQYNLITPTKMQDGGLCWAYAGSSAFETAILKDGTMPGRTNNDIKMVPEQLDWITHVRDTSKSEYDPLGLTNQDWFRDQIWLGEVTITGLRSLTQWNGPLITGLHSKPNPHVLDHNASVGLKNAIIIKQNIDDMKRALVKYGALTTGYWAKDHSDSPFNHIIYMNPGQSSYAHTVTIVGWDDTISKHKFNNTPSRDGAWIIKNSWGSNWGASLGDPNGYKGYFYLSYDYKNSDSTIAVDTMPRSLYQNNYYYDGRMQIADTYHFNEVGAIFPTLKASYDTTEKIKAINFSVKDIDNAQIQIDVYTNVSANYTDRFSPLNDPTSGTLATSKTVTIQYPGIYTIDLDKEVEITRGSNFGVVLKILTNNEANKNAHFELSQEQSSNNDMTFTKEGNGWTNLWRRGYSVARIKAFTTQTPKSGETSTSNDLKYATVKLNANVIKYGSTEPKPEPVVMFGSKKLTKDVDYTVEYINQPPLSWNDGTQNAIVGSCRVKVIGKGLYSGINDTAWYSIKRAAMPNLEGIGTFDPNQGVLNMTVYDNVNKYSDIILPSEWRFIEPDKVVNVGQNTGNYLDYVGADKDMYHRQMFNVVLTKTTDPVNQQPIDSATVTFDKTEYPYEENPIIPNVTVTLNGTTLVKNRDYVLTGDNNVHVTDAATLRITGKGLYKGTIQKTFKIVKAQNNYVNIKLENNEIVVDAKYGKPVAEIKYYSDAICTKEIAKPTDPTQIYYAKAFIADTNDYNGCESNILKIDGVPPAEKPVEKKDISTAIVSLDKESFVYTGKSIDPKVTVKLDGKVLLKGIHYNVSYDNNTNVTDNAKVIVTGIGSYSGSVTKIFTITKATYNVNITNNNGNNVVVNSSFGTPQIKYFDDPSCSNEISKPDNNYDKPCWIQIHIEATNNYDAYVSEPIEMKPGSSIVINGVNHQIGTVPSPLSVLQIALIVTGTLAGILLLTAIAILVIKKTR